MAIPHNTARADGERKWVLMKAFFCRNTLCISRKNDKIRAHFIRQLPQTYCAVLPKIFYSLSSTHANAAISASPARARP